MEIYKGAASLYHLDDPKVNSGGVLHLTESELVFNAHLLNFGGATTTIIPLNTIRQSGEGVHVYSYKFNQIKVETNDGITYRFIVSKGAREKWIRLIAQYAAVSTSGKDNTLPSQPPGINPSSTLKNVSETTASAAVGFFGKIKNSVNNARVEAAIKRAYEIEEEKRKPHIQRIEHKRELTPQEQLLIGQIDMQLSQLEAEHFSLAISVPDTKEERARAGTLSGSIMNLNIQKNKILNGAVWIEEKEIPPEIDPSVPIYVDEEAIRRRILGK